MSARACRHNLVRGVSLMQQPPTLWRLAVCGDSLFQQHLFRGACYSIAIAKYCNRPEPHGNHYFLVGISMSPQTLFVVLIYGNNSPNVARNYRKILILVVTDSYHNGQNLCGEKQLPQYNRFMVKGLFQQR
jgi:hypothetical protein